MSVPFRAFDPAIDTLYWGQYQSCAVSEFFRDPANAELGRSLRHVAAELTHSFHSDVWRNAELVRRTAVDLETLSWVVADSSSGLSSGDVEIFLPPVRRCRLRDVSARGIAIVRSEDDHGYGLVSSSQPDRITLQDFIQRSRGEMDKYARKLPPESLANDSGGGTAWSAKEESLTGVVIKAQTFEEYRMDKDTGVSTWVEVCKGQELRPHRQLPTIQVEDLKLKKPEESQVLEEDCRWEKIPRGIGGDPFSDPYDYFLPADWDSESGEVLE